MRGKCAHPAIRRNWPGAVGGAALLVLLASCASPAAQAGQQVPAAGASDGRATATQVAGLPHPRVVSLAQQLRYVDLGIVLDPPGDAQAKVPWTSAYEACKTGDAICQPTMTPTIMLAKVTDPNHGDADSNGKLIPSLTGTLAWVISYTGVPCAPAGGAGAKPSGRQVTTTCTLVNFVSADTAAVLYSFQTSNP